jgi:hypothetical protein
VLNQGSGLHIHSRSRTSCFHSGSLQPVAELWRHELEWSAQEGHYLTCQPVSDGFPKGSSWQMQSQEMFPETHPLSIRRNLFCNWSPFVGFNLATCLIIPRSVSLALPGG